jgi:hypothetical protein
MLVRIKWLNHPVDSSLNGTEQKVSRSTATSAVEMKQAVISPYKNFVEYMSQFREGSSPQNVNPPLVSGTVWECGELPQTGRPVIWRKQGGEVARIETIEQAIAYGCPESTLTIFRRLLDEKNGVVNIAEAAKQGQAQRDAAEKSATWKTIWSRA